MFQVNIRNMEMVSEQFQAQIHRMPNMISEVNGVKAILGAMSGYSDVVGVIQNIATAMDEEKKNQNTLLSELKSTMECYRFCEGGIVNYAEDSKIIPQMSLQWTGVTPVVNSHGGEENTQWQM